MAVVNKTSGSRGVEEGAGGASQGQSDAGAGRRYLMVCGDGDGEGAHGSRKGSAGPQEDKKDVGKG